MSEFFEGLGRQLAPVIRLIFLAIIVFVLLFVVKFCLSELFGYWSPEVKISHERWSEEQKKDIAIAFDERSAKSKTESGIVGVLIEEAGAYYEDKTPVMRTEKEPLELRRGVKVMTDKITAEKKADEKSEGMIRVILRNPQGDFAADSQVVLIPSRKIKWENS